MIAGMNTETNHETLTLHLDGVKSDGGDVRLAVFAEKLSTLRVALQETDKFLYGIDTPTIDFLVTNLSHKSPAAVSIAAQPNGIIAEHQGRVFSHFSELLAKITSGAYVVASANHQLLTSLKDLISGYGKKYQQMWLSFKGETVAAVSDETLENLKQLLAKRYTSIGSIKGTIKKYNSQADKKTFHLSLFIGGQVKCFFEEDLLAKASAAVEKNVTIHGLLKYQEGDFFPYEVSVRDIEIMEPDASYQTLSGLIGTAKGITGGQSSEEFIKNIRNDWH